jgi:large subunit ribosomal protein L32
VPDVLLDIDSIFTVQHQSKMAMTAPAMRMASSSSFLPRLLAPTLFSTTRIQLHIRQFSLPLFPSFTLAVPVGFQLGLPSLPSILQDIRESVLKAVPKKKTSHMKKRHRQMAGKALDDVHSLCKCPACGEIKRMHFLCPNCAKSKKVGYSGPSLDANWDTELREMMNKEAREKAD